MFKEVVSLAIIFGFILNILYVDHPNTMSYTIAFVISLAALSPGAAIIMYRRMVRKRREIKEMEEMRIVMAEAAGRPVQAGRERQGEGVVRICCEVGKEVLPEVDLEKGLVVIGSVVQAERMEDCPAY